LLFLSFFPVHKFPFTRFENFRAFGFEAFHQAGAAVGAVYFLDVQQSAGTPSRQLQSAMPDA